MFHTHIFKNFPFTVILQNVSPQISQPLRFFQQQKYLGFSEAKEFNVFSFNSGYGGTGTIENHERISETICGVLRIYFWRIVDELHGRIYNIFLGNMGKNNWKNTQRNFKYNFKRNISLNALKESMTFWRNSQGKLLTLEMFFFVESRNIFRISFVGKM